MTVYVEYVILNNLIANYTVLSITNKLSVNSGRVRLWCSVLVSVIAGTLTPLILLDGVWVSCIKFGISIIIVTLITGKVRFKRYIVTFLIFYGVSFGVGGAVTAFCNFLSFRGVNIEEEKLTFIVLLGAVIFRYISGQALSYIKGREARREGIVYLKGKKGTIKATSFVDTGNTVTYNGVGVAFVNKKLQEKIQIFPTYDYVKVMTVSGSKIFEVQIAKVSYDNKTTKDLPIVFWEGGEKDVILYGGDTVETDKTYQKDTV